MSLERLSLEELTVLTRFLSDKLFSSIEEGNPIAEDLADAFEYAVLGSAVIVTKENIGGVQALAQSIQDDFEKALRMGRLSLALAFANGARQVWTSLSIGSKTIGNFQKIMTHIKKCSPGAIAEKDRKQLRSLHRDYKYAVKFHELMGDGSPFFPERSSTPALEAMRKREQALNRDLADFLIGLTGVLRSDLRDKITRDPSLLDYKKLSSGGHRGPRAR